MFITMFTQTGLLLGYCFLVDHYDTLTSRSIWTAILIAATARCALAMVVFIRGRWTDIRVEIEPQEPASF
jgi:Na+-driven multidrug efflux pump